MFALCRQPILLFFALLVLTFPSPTAADKLAEFLFWDSMGSQVGKAAASLQEYRKERALWKQNIADAEEELRRCGGCASAQAKLDKWQRTEDQFQRIAASALYSTGQSQAVADWLDIEMGPLPPIGAFPSSYDRGEGLVQRPDWIDDAPEFCKGPSEAYIAGLRDYQDHNRTTLTDWLIAPGGPYFDLSKLYAACRDKDYHAFEQETLLQQARAEGKVLPERGTYALATVIYYGEVPDSFILPEMPREAVEEELAKDSINEVWIRTKRTEPDLLTAYSVKSFQWSDLVPNSRCFESSEPAADEIDRRVCDDLGGASFAVDPPVLICQFPMPGANLQETSLAHMFWYGERPKIANPERLLERSHDHPLLSVGAPRTFCPPSRGETEAALKRFSGEIQTLRRVVPQAPRTVALPAPEELIRQREEAEAREVGLLEQRRATQEFAFPGRYSLERTDGSRPAEDCTVIEIYQPNYALICGQPEATNVFSASKLDAFTVFEMDGPGSAARLLALQEQGAVLEGGGFRLTRTGEIVSVAEIDIAGEFELRLTSEGTETNAICSLTSVNGADPNCVFTDGTEYRGNVVPSSETALSFLFSYPRWISFAGQQLTSAYIFVSPGGSLEPLTLELIDLHADIAGRLTRTSHTPAPTIPVTQPQIPEDMARQTGNLCEPRSIVGIYQTQYGKMRCWESAGLHCRYGPGFRNELELSLDENAARVNGTWVEGSATGFVEFDLMDNCAIGDGRWGQTMDRSSATNPWAVVQKLR